MPHMHWSLQIPLVIMGDLKACFHETALAKDVTKVGEQNLSSRGIEPRSLQPQCRILTTVRTRPTEQMTLQYIDAYYS